MKWPLAGVAVLAATGIVLGRSLPDLLPLPILLALWLGSTGAALLLRGEIASKAALALCLLLGGWTHFQASQHAWSPRDLRLQVPPSTRESIVTLVGLLEATPELRRHDYDGAPATNSIVILQVRELLRSPGSPVAAEGRVVVAAPFQPDPLFRSGATVRITGILRRPPRASAPGLFDYADHLHWRGIAFELRTQSPDDWHLDPGSSPPPPTLADRFRTWGLGVLAHGLDPREIEVGLLQAMTLGWKTGLTDELEEPFLRSGTLHVFAISGLHIALVAAIVEQALHLVLITRRAGGVVVIITAWLYTLATGFQPSAIRATLMTTCVVGGHLLLRPSNTLNSLAAAACLILLWDPRQLFQTGFQLSFAVVASLAILTPPLRAWLAPFADPDPLLPDRCIPAWRRTLTTAWRHLATTLAVGVASWLGSAPLTAAHFHLISISGFLANLAVVPLSSCALAANLAALAVAPFSLGPVELLNHAAWFFMHLMVLVSQWAASLPDTCWNVATPPTSGTLAWYLLLTATGLGAWRNPRLRIPLALLLATLSTLASVEFLRRANTPRLVVLPLGIGHAVWIHSRHESSLVDTGDARNAERIIAPFLQAQGVNDLDLLALTHGDVRHTGGAALVAQRFPPARLLLNPTPFRSAPHRKAMELLHALPTIPKPAPPPPPWRVLHPAPSATYPRADDGCLALEYPLGGARVLLLADLDRTGQEQLLRRHPNLRADLVILAPASRGLPPTDALLEQLEPGLIIVADAAHPATARAKPAFRDALQHLAARVLFTSDTGALDVRWQHQRLQVLDASGSPLPP